MLRDQMETATATGLVVIGHKRLMASPKAWITSIGSPAAHVARNTFCYWLIESICVMWQVNNLTQN
jgi:hypothetical protein